MNTQTLFLIRGVGKNELPKKEGKYTIYTDGMGGIGYDPNRFFHMDCGFYLDKNEFRVYKHVANSTLKNIKYWLEKIPSQPVKSVDEIKDEVARKKFWMSGKENYPNWEVFEKNASKTEINEAITECIKYAQQNKEIALPTVDQCLKFTWDEIQKQSKPIQIDSDLLIKIINFSQGEIK